jgi:hypothetical protein
LSDFIDGVGGSRSWRIDDEHRSGIDDAWRRVSTMVNSVMSSMVVVGVASMSVGAAMPTMVDDVVSMWMSMADEAMSMSMAIGDAESTVVADDEPSILVGVERSAMVGERAGESVDLDPVVPMVGAN